MEEQNQLNEKQENPEDDILEEPNDQVREDTYMTEEKQEADAATVVSNDGNPVPPLQQNHGNAAPPLQQNYWNPIPPLQQNYWNPIPPLQQNYWNPIPPLQQNYGNATPPLQQNYWNPIPPLQQNHGNPIPPLQQNYGNATLPLQQNYENQAPPAKYGIPNQVVPPMNVYANRNGEISNGMAIASMVLGIVSIVLCWWFILALPCAIVGLTLGCVYRYKGGKSGMSVAGIICGSVGIALAVIEICLYIMSFGAMLYSY